MPEVNNPHIVILSQSEATLRVAWNELKKHISPAELVEKDYNAKLAIAAATGIIEMTDAILKVIEDRRQDERYGNT